MAQYAIRIEIDNHAKLPARSKKKGLQSVLWLVVIRSTTNNMFQIVARGLTYEVALDVVSAAKMAFQTGLTEARNVMRDVILQSCVHDTTPDEDTLLQQVRDADL